MINLIYVSNASQEMNDQELIELLELSRNNNKMCNVTGMLLYAEGNFSRYSKVKKKM